MSVDVPIPTSSRCEGVTFSGATLDTYSQLYFRTSCPNIYLGVIRFCFGLIVNIWAATRKTTGSNPVQSHLIDV